MYFIHAPPVFSILGRESALQDILRLLTVWFEYGEEPSVATSLQRGFNDVPIDTWLQVMPQIVARIDTPSRIVRAQVSGLLMRIAQVHPQVSDPPCNVRREGGQSLVVGGSSLVSLEGKACNPLQSLSSQALLFPLLVSLEAASAERTSAAAKLMSAIASAHGSLVLGCGIRGGP